MKSVSYLDLDNNGEHSTGTNKVELYEITLYNKGLVRYLPNKLH